MREKTAATLRQAMEAAHLEDGMTISFHHHLRNGDFVLDMVLREAEAMGLKGLRVAASSVFPCHGRLARAAERGVVAGLDTNYMSGPVAAAVARGAFAEPVRFRTHGGRPRAIDAGELHIDAAFIAAPAVDPLGNLSGVEGPSACGSLGYAMADAAHADTVIAVTDHFLDHSPERISIDHGQVDVVVKVDRIGDPAGIVSGTTKVTRDPVGLVIAEYAARAIEAAGLLRDGFCFQTGAGGASLAAASFVRERMREQGVRGRFLLGGITGYFVDMLEEGLFEDIYDVQCFDLAAVRSIRENAHHHEISASDYASVGRKRCYVDDLGAVLLGATEIDLDFNVNVHTDSNGVIIGGSGGHSDAAAGAEMAIIVAPLLRARLPIVVDRVRTVSTPGRTVDALVTEYGAAVNPARPELAQRLRDFGLPVFEIAELRRKALAMAGEPVRAPQGEREVAVVEYRDGTIIDRIMA
ncbi:MAG: citrate lyase subunit alpha [Desulfovibrionaceae bacterium]|nr:citrate lyase subunit alpha [Desulfovibrionaceae bacterium]